MTTEEIIYNMLVENTGIHFLDSGMGSGRHWQKNQVKTLEDFKKEDYVQYDKDYGITLSLFHHLDQALEYNHEMTEDYIKHLKDKYQDDWSDFDNRHGLESYFEGDTWIKINCWSCCTRGKLNFENSYNCDSVLSQNILMAWIGDIYDNDFIAISIHGGADVRGGYTGFKFFDMDQGQLFDFDYRSWNDPETLEHYLNDNDYRHHLKTWSRV
tara:strand:- start:142 stop:777 length:636 start_codon:yes stop_codon:yes gene_type:complete